MLEEFRLRITIINLCLRSWYVHQRESPRFSTLGPSCGIWRLITSRSGLGSLFRVYVPQNPSPKEKKTTLPELPAQSSECHTHPPSRPPVRPHVRAGLPLSPTMTHKAARPWASFNAPILPVPPHIFTSNAGHRRSRYRFHYFQPPSPNQQRSSNRDQPSLRTPEWAAACTNRPLPLTVACRLCLQVR